MRNQMTKILCYKSKDIHLPSSMYLDPLCVQINNILRTGYCNILCKYVNMAFFYYVCCVLRFNTLGPHPLTVTLGRSPYITISRLSGLYITL